MKFSHAISAYEGFARRLAHAAARGIDGLFTAPRRIRTEATNIVLGAEAMPAPVPARYGRRIPPQ